jgi:hypothetical protein
VGSRGLGQGRAGVTLVDIGEGDALASDLLDGFGELADLRPVLGFGRSDVQRRQMAQCIHRRMQLGALLPLGSIVAGAAAALGCGAERAAVENGGTWFGSPPFGQAQHGAEVMRYGLEAARRQPAPRLVAGRLPGREVARQQAPGRPGTDDPAQRIDPAERAAAARSMQRLEPSGSSVR